MTRARRKRALLLVGAGASVEFGAPATAKLTDSLAGYYRGGTADVNFEQIFHCAHELLFTFPPTSDAVNEYRPALVPFLARRFEEGQEALRALLGAMTGFIYQIISEACAIPKVLLGPLARFIERLRSDYVTRIYTTNYDDFLLQAAPDLFTGFEAAGVASPARFRERPFWEAADRDSLYFLHGSIHLGFSHPATSARWAELHWYADRAEAARNATYTGSGLRRQDGTTVDPTAIITGLDKLSRLQQAPFSYYHSALAEDALRADIIFVLGYGLGDLHLNNWLHEARLQSPPAPIILVDRWEGGFPRRAALEANDRKILDMWHDLRMLVGHQPWADVHSVEGWTADAGRTCAVWGDGFQRFLNTPDRLDAILTILGVPDRPRLPLEG